MKEYIIKDKGIWKGIKLKQIGEQFPKCPNCETGYLIQVFSRYTCNNCNSEFKAIK